MKRFGPIVALLIFFAISAIGCSSSESEITGGDGGDGDIEEGEAVGGGQGDGGDDAGQPSDDELIKQVMLFDVNPMTGEDVDPIYYQPIEREPGYMNR